MAGIAPSHFSDITNGKARPHWKTAGRLARVTNTNRELWLEGTPKEIQQAVLIFQLNNLN